MGVPALAEQVKTLITTNTNKEDVQSYFSKIANDICAGRHQVRQDSGSVKGKGVFAQQGFAVGDLLWQEPPVVALQHTTNRGLAFTCGHCFRFLGSVEAQLAWQLLNWCNEPPDEAAAGQVEQLAQLAQQLETGKVQLPGSDALPLPKPVACPGGCSGEVYCSADCAQAAWTAYHRLLCPANGGLASASSGSGGGGGGAVNAAALQEFEEHAQASNDTFRLVGRVYSQVLQAADAKLQELEQAGTGISAEARQWAALQYGWHPFSFVHKRLWWECMAAPEDVPAATFRREVRELAVESLELLKAALADARFPALFAPEVFGSVVGMFELNNLGLVVPSPVAAYLDMVDEDRDEESEEDEEMGAAGAAGKAAADCSAEVQLSADARAAARKVLGPIMDAVGDSMGEPCEGTALYALQACANHSCDPNAHAFKRECDVDGGAVLLAQKDIAAGDEITISYIDEAAPLAERRAALADYGFVCTCMRCQQEQRNA